MADISKITLPNGDEYYLKDAYIRDIVQNNHVSKNGTGNIVDLTGLADEVPFQDVIVDFEPHQDLRGMDAPYPPGSTSNLIPDGTDTSNGYVCGTNGSYLDTDGNINAVSSGSMPWYVSEYFPVIGEEIYTLSQSKTTGNAASICFYDANKEYISGVPYDELASQIIIVPTDAVYARASQCYWERSAINVRFIVQFELGPGTTIHHYSNICPPIGRESIDFYVRGKNILKATPEYFRTSYPARSILDEDGSVAIYTSSVTFGFVCPVEPNTQYTASAFKNLGYSFYLYVYEYATYPRGTSVPISVIHTEYIKRAVAVTSKATQTEHRMIGKFTTSANTKYVIVTGYRSGASEGLVLKDFQLERGESFTEYTPSEKSAKDYTVNLGKTAYGGTLNASTGEFTEEWAFIDAYDGEELPGEWISDRDVYDSEGTPTIGAQVLYKLETSVQNTCDPAYITSVEGNDQIWSNEDELSLSYNYIKDFPYSFYDPTRIFGKIDGLYEPSFDVLSVSKGGTGASTLTSGSALIGNGANAVTFRPIVNNTAAGPCGWTSAAASTQLITLNTLSYWNGYYKSGLSNLQYCKLGEFKALATKDTTFVATTSSNGLMSAADKTKVDDLKELSTKDTTFVATTSSNGLMSAADKTKMENIGALYDATTETISLSLGNNSITVNQNPTTGNLDIS